MCMENPEIPGRIQMERFIPFAVLPFTRSYRNDRNFPTIVWITSAGLHVERK